MLKHRNLKDFPHLPWSTSGGAVIVSWPIMAIVNANDNDDHNGGTKADELYRSE